MAEPTIVIPSFNRHRTITTHRHVSDAIVCVPESQADRYAAAVGADRVVTHSDDILGVGAKRNFIMQNWSDVMMLDDDSNGMRRMYQTNRRNYRLTPDEARDRIYMTAETAAELGAYVYGFADYKNPLYHKTVQPFSFGGLVGGWSLGLRKGHGLHCPKELIDNGDDAFISYLNAFYHRYVFVDTRFGMCSEMETNEGGCASYREGRWRDNAFRTLHAAFGDAVVPHEHALGGGTANTCDIPWPYD